MPRIRSVKPEFWSSPSVTAMSPWARLLFIAMWNWADDTGRGTFNPRELVGFAFPNDEDLGVPEFRALCAEIRAHCAVNFYRYDGRDFYAIPSWARHQSKHAKLSGSKYPDPADGVPIDPLSSQVIGDVPENGREVAEIRAHVAESCRKMSLGTGEQGNRGEGEKGNAGVKVITSSTDREAHESTTPSGENSDEPPAAAEAAGPSIVDSLDALAAAYATSTATAPDGGTPDQWSTPEDPRCWKHRHHSPGTVPPCGACAQARVWFTNRAAEAEHAAATSRAARRAAIDACDACDANGLVLIDGTAHRCDHRPVTTAPAETSTAPADEELPF